MQLINEINRLGGFYGQATRWGVYDINGLAPTVTAASGMGGGHTPMLLINEDEKKNKCTDIR